MRRTGIVTVFAVLCAIVAMAHAKDCQIRLRREIQEIRSHGQTAARTEAAERVEQLTKKMRPSDVDDKTFSDLVSLLDIPDDSVRAWIAAAIGNLGPRAKPAVPQLLKLLSEIECTPVMGGLNSEGFIRIALKRIGAAPPRTKCGSGTHSNS